MRVPTFLLVFAVIIAGLGDTTPADEDATRGMILVPGGKFTMGRDAPEGEKPAADTPAHEVEVAPFYISRFEVTNREFALFIEAKGYQTKSLWSGEGWKWVTESKRSEPHQWKEIEARLGEEFGKHPVVGVNWFEADAYARWVGKRLLTESEWEYAARGTDGRRFPWGNAFAAYVDNRPEGSGGTIPVGTHPVDRSPTGVFDMGGNVSEWTASSYGPYPGTKFESRLEPGKYRVARGGSWRFIDDGADAKATTTYRSFQYSHVTRGVPFMGFRVAMDAPKKKDAEKKADSPEEPEEK